MELSRLKWIKNVRPLDQNSGASKMWAYDENLLKYSELHINKYNDHFFRLMFFAKSAALLPRVGDMAFLKQNNKLTHLVEFTKDIYDIKKNSIGRNAVDREVKIVWWKKNPEEMRGLPSPKQILGYEPGTWPGTFPRPYYECGDFRLEWGDDDEGFKEKVAEEIRKLGWEE